MRQDEGSDSLGHLCRQVGSAQAHIVFADVFTLNSEISQLSIGLIFSPKHSGHFSLSILPPRCSFVIPLSAQKTV
jgi:hypothetical protein